MSRDEPNGFPSWIKVAILAIVIGLFAGGMVFYHAQQRLQEKAVQENLLSIANLKVDQIADWRLERMADAAILMKRRGLSESVERFIQEPTERDKSEIIRRLLPVKERYHFADIFLVDPQMNVRLALVSKTPLCPEHIAAVEKALETGRTVWSRLHSTPLNAAPHVSVAAPLFSTADPRRPVGSLVMVCDAAQFLYPLVQSWPTPSETAETLLVRKDGEEVLFLNELRHAKNTALTLRIPLHRTDLPAAKAIAGVEGIVEGKDYRGVDVIAAILPVSESPWFMVAKIDTAEAFAEWRFRSLLIPVFMISAIGLVIAAGLVLRQRSLKTHYRRLYRSQAELSRSLKRYQITLRAIGDAVISTDRRGRIQFMNPVAEDLTGWRQKSALGKPLSEVFRIVSEETREPMADPVARVLEEGNVVGLANHTLLMAIDGREIPIADSGSPIRSENGEIFGVVLVFKDQSGERRYQNRILESEKKYRLLADNTLDVIWTMDLGLRFTYVNPAIRQLTGYEPEQWQDTHLSDHVSRASFEKIREIIGKEIAKGPNHRGVVFETEMIKKDGNRVPVEIHGMVLFDENGNPTRLQGATRDITERKEARKKEEMLEHRFHQAQKLESIGRLAGGIAHDLNNLLSPVIGYGEMLLEHTTEGDPGRDPLEEITRAGIRARDLVRQLLAFSRKQTLEFKSIDLNTLLENFDRLLRRTIREDVAIEMRLAPSLPLVKGDASQLEQVVMNLAVNAQDAMPDGGELTIETAVVELDENYAALHEGVSPGPHVMLVVTDTGLGMDEEIREHLFEPFFTTKEKERGTGLGLATVFGIVKQHGGNIWAYSEPGQGSTIKVYLPVAAGQRTSPALERRPPMDAAMLAGSETILLVEDDAQVRKLAQTLLEQKGYTVLPSQNGKEALERLSGSDAPVHLLLTDVVMPDMNGKELFEKVAVCRPGIEVLYMSGYTNNVIAHRGVLDTGIHFVQKPFTSRTLLEKIREVLNASDHPGHIGARE